jgi:hypothetical protein
MPLTLDAFGLADLIAGKGSFAAAAAEILPRPAHDLAPRVRRLASSWLPRVRARLIAGPVTADPPQPVASTTQAQPLG